MALVGTSPAHSGDNVNCRDVGYGTVTAIIARWRPARSNYIQFLPCFVSTDRESYRPSVSCLWKYYEFVGETKRSKIQSWQQLVWLLCDTESRADFPHLIHATGLVGHVALPPPMDR